jgi:GTP pyrophosphokinase
MLEKAYVYVSQKHKNIFRKSGEPYINHLIEVACTLAELNAGPATLVAGLLHDVIEDTDTSLEEVTNLFSEEIATLVNSVTKITKLSQYNLEDYQANNHRKLFIAMARDIRVIIIKLADRLHNMRTLNYMPEEKQKIIARETLEIYAPIAHRLGISQVKTELENLSLYYLENAKYHEVEDLINQKITQREEKLNKIIKNVSAILKANNIPFEIVGREKSIYSVYKKMYIKEKDFEEIYDLQAIRIITLSKVNCYEILGYIHDTYRPIPGRFKDYIAMPKPNMYQSLHTTIVTEKGDIFEIQIRTKEMDEIAESGVAAHWRYKENVAYDPQKEQKEIETKLNWFKNLISITNNEQDDDAKSYIDSLTHDIFEANVYCLTPKGKIIDLPAGATPIDFAYRVHSDVGHQMVGAIINGSIAPLSTPLKTGDIVEIKTNKNTGPSEDWLQIAKTSSALGHIKKYLKQQLKLEDRDEAISKGKEILEIASREENLKFDFVESFLKDPKNKKILLYTTIDDLYYAIGNRYVSAGNVIAKIDHENKVQQRLIEKTNEILNKKVSTVEKTSGNQNEFGILIEGLDSVAVILAQCCSPIPGDGIVGYISRGQGVKIHRQDCRNILNEKERLIEAHWSKIVEDSPKYLVYLNIICNDRNNLLMDIINSFSMSKIPMQSIKGITDKRGLVTINVIIKVKSSIHLSEVISLLNNIPGVLNVDRINHN